LNHYDHFSLPTIDDRFYRAIPVAIQEIGSSQGRKLVGPPKAGGLMAGCADGHESFSSELNLFRFGIGDGTGRRSERMRIMLRRDVLFAVG